MATRNSTDYRVCIVPEETYNTQQLTLTDVKGAEFFDDKLEWNYAPLTTELGKKENSLYKFSARTKITGKLVTGTLSGELTDGHTILLNAHFDDTGSPFLYATALPATKSYNVYQLYLNSAGAITHYDVILGAIINPLVISGEANGIIQYTATIEGADYRQEVANAAADLLITTDGYMSSGEPFLFGAVTCTNFSNLTTLLSFNLELRKTMVDNSQRFMNSLTKANDYYNQVGGTIQTTSLFDATADSGWMAALTNGSAYAITINLVSVTPHTWEIETGGTITDASRPDADRGLFVQNLTADIAIDNVTLSVPVTITVT